MDKTRSFQAEGPTEAGACPVITSRKAMWRSVVPVTIKRDVPLQIAEDFHVVRGVGIEPDAARIRYRRQKGSGDIEIGFAESEHSSLSINEARCHILTPNGVDSLFIVCVLPGYATE